MSTGLSGRNCLIDPARSFGMETTVWDLIVLAAIGLGFLLTIGFVELSDHL